MSTEIDLSGEQDPTERMAEFAELRAGKTADDVIYGESSEQQERAMKRAGRDQNDRDADYNGSVETEEYSVEEALEQLGGD